MLKLHFFYRSNFFRVYTNDSFVHETTITFTRTRTGSLLDSFVLHNYCFFSCKYVRGRSDPNGLYVEPRRGVELDALTSLVVEQSERVRPNPHESTASSFFSSNVYKRFIRTLRVNLT